jgi:hypothetical protein
MKKCLKTPKEAKKGRNKTYDILEMFASNLKSTTEEINRIGLVKSKLKQSNIGKNKIILP